MKTTKYLIYAVPALMLAACASDEPTDGGAGADGAAVVRADIGAVTSRAVGNQWETKDCIGISGVSGSVTYDNVPYFTVDGDGSFVSVEGVANGIFFQNGDRATFSAYYPYDEHVSAANPVIKAKTEDQHSNYSFDFLYASGAKGSLKEPALNFTGEAAFAHCMAQLVINITADNEAGFNGELMLHEGEINLSGIALEGVFDTSTGIAHATGSSITYSLTDNAKMMSDGYIATFSLIYFPQTVSDMKLSIEYEGNSYICPLTPTLAAGKRYTANLTLKKTGLSVGNASITDWVGNGTFNGEANIHNPFNGHEAVLMRKASGKKGEPDYVPALYVATCNIGADAPQADGLYFVWGMTDGHNGNSGQNIFDNYHIGLTKIDVLYKDGYVTTPNEDTAVLTPEHDPASVYWGGDWKMPDKHDLQWLADNTEWTYTTRYNGTTVNGCTVVSKETGGEIFLPMSGYFTFFSSAMKDYRKWGYYLSSSCGIGTSCYNLRFVFRDTVKIEVSPNSLRELACPVRPVVVM